MTERQGRVEQGAEDKRARDFEFAPKLRLRRTVHLETTVHSRDGRQGKYGTVPDFRRAAAPVRSQRVGEAAGSCCDRSRRGGLIGFVLPKWRCRVYLVEHTSANLHSWGDFGFVLPKTKFDCMLMISQSKIATTPRGRVPSNFPYAHRFDTPYARSFP
jgi:hypothetical protein